MFIGVLELFKIGIGPSSSHTMGPMAAARDFVDRVREYLAAHQYTQATYIRCILKGSLAFTGKGHATDRAVTLGLHGYTPEGVAEDDVDAVVDRAWNQHHIAVDDSYTVMFSPGKHIIFDYGDTLPAHPNGMIFELIGQSDEVLFSETYFSIGGGFISTLAEIKQVVAPLKMSSAVSCPHPFDTAGSMLQMATDTGLSIAAMKRINELEYLSDDALNRGLDSVWQAMQRCVEAGLMAEGVLYPEALFLPGGQRACMNNFRQIPTRQALTTGYAPTPWR